MKKKYYREERSEIRQFLPHKYLKVLEIGCGEGNFISSLNIDSEKWGIEPNKDAYEKIPKKIYKAFNLTYETSLQYLPDNYFDLVICNDVIEHLFDHDYFFESIKTKMTSNAYLIGSVPNVRYFENVATFLINKDWKYVDFGILDKTHLRFFTEKSFLRMINSHKFIVEKFKGINKLSLKPLSIKMLLKVIVIYLIVFLTMGYYKDILFLQFGFRLKKLN
jgi:2-polyprenyl-3-methyl-5-hydroxy-6-metoxy-1,4-benzoquinol methylase